MRLRGNSGNLAARIPSIALAVHRWNSGWTRLVDYMVMVPRAMPGLVAGLAPAAVLKAFQDGVGGVLASIKS